MYINWTYTHNLKPEDVPDCGTAEHPSTRGIVNLYLLGDVLDDVKFRNETMRILNSHSDRVNRIPSHQTITRIWENTPENSLLTKWTVASAVSRMSSESFTNGATNAKLPADFIAQVATKLMLLERNARMNPVLAVQILDYLELEADA